MKRGNELNGKLFAGNPHKRFEEREVSSETTPRRGVLLFYKILLTVIVILSAWLVHASSYIGAIELGAYTWKVTGKGGLAIWPGGTWPDSQGRLDIRITGVSPAPYGTLTIPNQLWFDYDDPGRSSWSISACCTVVEIGVGAFNGCNGVRSIEIPDSVTSIGENTFKNCSSLEHVEFGSGLTSIEKSAFYGCEKLKHVTFKGNAPRVTGRSGSSLFPSSCIIEVNGNSTGWDDDGDGKWNGLTLKYSGTVTFNANGGTGNMTRTVVSGTTIGTLPTPTRDGYAFAGWWTTKSGGTLVTGQTIIRGNVTFYAHWARICVVAGHLFEVEFNGPTITIPDGVTSIETSYPSDYFGPRGYSDFAYRSGLTSVVIPDSVKYIEDHAFSGCSDLESVKLGNGLTSIEPGLFSGCRSLTSITIPNSVKSIGDDAFWHCSGLTSVTIGNGVTSIGDFAFYVCSGLTNVTIPDGVTSIGDYAFSCCSGLTSVTIPDGVTSIGRSAFSSCSGLTSVTIPSSVKHIGFGAFGYCNGLTSVRFNGNAPTFDDNPLNISGAGAFYFSSLESLESCTILVRPGSVGWGVTIPGTWHGLRIEYIDDEPSAPSPSPQSTSQPTPQPTPQSALGYEVIAEKDIVAPYKVSKAVTLQGVVYEGGKVVGIVELKLGKVNDKKGTGKVSGSVTSLDGKKHTITASNLGGIDGTTSKAVTLEVKDFGTMSVTIGGAQFAGSMGKYHVQSAAVGGDWNKGGTKVYVDATSASLPAGVLEELLPNGEPIVASGGKWKFAKATSVKWAKPKQGAALPERYDAESGKGLVIDTLGGKTNLSAMKLSYTPKKGTFKGSFKVYALEGSGKATMLKKYTIKVSGVVVGGVGYGTATSKTPAASWAVTVK